MCFVGALGRVDGAGIMNVSGKFPNGRSARWQ
jgi:hypothetical protein